MASSLSHNAYRLMDASLERVEASRRAREARDPVMCIYLGGLAVECLLQAIVHLDTQKHDAGHNLARWLGRCRASFQDAVKAKELRASWNHLCAVWRNEYRYYSKSALSGQLRKMGRTRGIRGEQESQLNEAAKRFLESVVHVHNKGLAAWANYTKK